MERRRGKALGTQEVKFLEILQIVLIFCIIFPAYFVIVSFCASTLEWPVAGFVFSLARSSVCSDLAIVVLPVSRKNCCLQLFCFRSMLNIDKRGKDRLNDQAGLKP